MPIHQQKVNTDEYLLRKRIDKNVEVMKEDHEEVKGKFVYTLIIIIKLILQWDFCSDVFGFEDRFFFCL